jgi:hypothetical protein
MLIDREDHKCLRNGFSLISLTITGNRGKDAPVFFPIWLQDKHIYIDK